jgi:hypothetical protein
VFAVITRVPGGEWRLLAGPFMYVGEAHDVALRVLGHTPQGEALVATCPWEVALDERRNVDGAREAGAIERVTA